MAVDTLIKGAQIIDGTGRPRYYGDVAINGGRVVAVGNTQESGAKVIQADGLAATPGFWDVHTHYDAQLLWDPIATSSVWHGITTIVTGNCGFTIAPVRPSDQEYTVRSLSRVEEMERSALESTLPWSWETFGEYLDLLDDSVGVNVLAMVGHSAVRRYVMGEDATQRTASQEEIQAMCLVVRESLRAGAMGFTSTRAGVHWDGEGQPVPSRLATEDEYRALVSEMAGMRCGFIQGISPPELNIELARRAGRPYLSSPVTQTLQGHPGEWRQQLERLQLEIENGGRTFGMGPVNRTQYEMTMENTSFFDRWPSWQQLMVAPSSEQVQMMRDIAYRNRMRDEMTNEPLPIIPFSWGLVTLVHSVTGRWSRLEGKTVIEIAEELDKDPLDAVFDIALDEDLKTHFRAGDTRYPDEDVMMSILKAPHIVVGMSDAGAHLARQVNAAFPSRLLGYWSRDRALIGVEEAVNILAARPADEVGVTDRGRLIPGNFADIVLVDLETVNEGERVFAHDLPGGARRLVQPAHGVAMVMVNGIVVNRDGRDTGELGGQVIRSTWMD